MSTLAVSRRETTNLGDLVCSPCLYFDYEATHYDCRGTLPQADNYIFGGGAITRVVAQQDVQGIKIAWGIGQTNRDNTLKEHGFNDFALVGSRDVGQADATWVPCASCISPLFDKEYEIKHKAVQYRNSVKYTHPDMPWLTNRNISLEDALNFIGSAEVVFTDSYHGAYWATLLGRAAVIVNPYSSKFYHYKHQPATEGEVPRTYPEALKECREANIRFNNEVQQIL